MSEPQGKKTVPPKTFGQLDSHHRFFIATFVSQIFGDDHRVSDVGVVVCVNNIGGLAIVSQVFGEDMAAAFQLSICTLNYKDKGRTGGNRGGL